jgi:hypothetical protein
MAEDPVPAVTEAEATGETAAIFADIRAVYRVGAVNLIWRHLATIPDSLPWAWRAIRPLYVDGTIGRGAVAFRASLRRPVQVRVPPEVFASFALSVDDVVRIRGVLASYDRTNSMALIALTALVLAKGVPLKEMVGKRSDRAAFTPPPRPLPQGEGERFCFRSLATLDDIPMPVLTPLNAMPPHVAALVTRLNDFGTIAGKPILASMYRHLSHWPPYLGFAWAVLAPLDASGLLRAAIGAASDRAETLAAAIPMDAGPPPPCALDAIAPFIGDVLPKMVAICGMLRAMTNAPDA